MGKKTIKGYLKGMLPDIIRLKKKVQDCATKHPEMFVDVDNTDSCQVTGFLLSLSFEKKKGDNKSVKLLCMDAWLGHNGFPSAKLRLDWSGDMTLEEEEG